MKKQFLLAVGVLTVFIGAKGQKPDTALLMVHYKFTHVWDTTNRARPDSENMVLFVGKIASAYRSYDGLVADQQFKKAYEAMTASSPDGRPLINRRGIGTPTRYYQYPNEQKLLIKENLVVNQYLIEGAMPVIKWKISGDTATFGGLHCQKATGHFKGRDYIVWFCPDLPVHTGPWKLNGLPGVIVDAHDTKNEVVFKFDGVEKVVPSPPKSKPIAANTDEKDRAPMLRGLDEDPNLIVPPASLTKTTQKEFDKLKDAIIKNPDAFAQSINNQNAGKNAPRVVMKAEGDITINNPIELPEK